MTATLNNSSMAIECRILSISHGRYRALDIGRNYADLGCAMAGYTERVEKPDDIIAAIQRARRMNEEGRAVLLEFITCEEIASSHRRASRLSSPPRGLSAVASGRGAGGPRVVGAVPEAPPIQIRHEVALPLPLRSGLRLV